MKKIVLIGNTLAADIIYSYLSQDKRYAIVAFAVDKEYIKETTKFALPVVDFAQITKNFPPSNHNVILGVGYSGLNTTREALFNRVKSAGYTVETYIHPEAKVYTQNPLGEGAIIFPNSVVEVFASIGTNSVIWANCVIGHHVRIGNNCWIASGTVVAGQASVGNNSFLGVNVTISNKISVASFNVIGGHVAIHKDTKDNEAYICGQGEKHRFPASDYAKYFLK